MKNKLVLAAAAAAFAAIPAVAQAQEEASASPYFGAQVGLHDLGVSDEEIEDLDLDIDDSAMIYGGYAGVDFNVGTSFVIGVEGNFNLGNGPIDNEYGASARIGMRTANGSVIFVRGGYQWVNIDLEGFTGVDLPPADADDIDDTIDDYLVGIGADIATGGNARIRVALDTISFDTLRPTVGINFAF